MDCVSHHCIHYGSSEKRGEEREQSEEERVLHGRDSGRLLSLEYICGVVSRYVTIFYYPQGTRTRLLNDSKPGSVLMLQDGGHHFQQGPMQVML